MNIPTWVLYNSVAYLRGRGASFGGSLAPQGMIGNGVYSIGVSPFRFGPEAAVDKDLSIFADGELDHVYLGPGMEALQEVEPLFREASEKLKLGGNLLVHFKIDHREPGVFPLWGTQIEEMVSNSGKWQEKISHDADGQGLRIYKKLCGKRGILPQAPKSPKPRVCVVRYGAFGDAIIITPLLRKLKEDGYEVTLNINPYCKEVFQHNPNVDNLLIQEKDSIPNSMLEDYWKFWAKSYDRYINLSESLEGDLLVVEGRKEFFTHKSWRHARCDQNYYDYVFKRAGYGPETYGQVGEMFFTTAEEREARKFFDPLAQKFVVLWALNGSSHHKVYPLMEATLLEWFKTHPDSVCITVGDYMAKLLEFEHPQLIERAGKWKIRQSLLATKHADLVIGPETAMTNASGCYPTPKIVLLSHSSKENLTKYFVNDFSLEPDLATSPCYPCHQLHYTKESCPIGSVVDTSSGVEIGKAPMCAIAISPQRVLAEMEKVYQLWRSHR